MTPREAKTALRAVNLILWRDWNPVGCGVPADEYDSYAGPVLTLLVRGASDAEIAAHLDHIARDCIGVELPCARTAAVIDKLRALGLSKSSE